MNKLAFKEQIQLIHKY